MKMPDMKMPDMEMPDMKMPDVPGMDIPGMGPKGYAMGFFDMKCPPPEWKEKYAAIAEPTLEPYGGKFLIKHPIAPPMVEKMGAKAGGSFAPAGQQTGQMAFCLQFESFEKAEAWFSGPEYGGVLKVRDELSDFMMAVVEECQH